MNEGRSGLWWLLHQHKLQHEKLIREMIMIKRETPSPPNNNPKETQDYADWVWKECIKSTGGK